MRAPAPTAPRRKCAVRGASPPPRSRTAGPAPHARVQALRFHQARRDDPVRRAPRERAARSDHEARIPGAQVVATLVQHPMPRETPSGSTGAGRSTGPAARSARAPDPRDLGQLLVQVAPLAQPDEGQEVLLAPAPQRTGAGRGCSPTARHRFSTPMKSERSSANDACARSAAAALSAGRSRGSWMLRKAAITRASARQRCRPASSRMRASRGSTAATPSACRGA